MTHGHLSAQDGPSVVVHPHGCPKCGGVEIRRLHHRYEVYSQKLDRIENFHGGTIGLRSVSTDEGTVIESGARVLRLQCTSCGYESADPLDFVTEVRQA